MSDAFDPYLKWLGIPPKDRPADFYRLLGVERFESDPDVITNAADQRMAHLKNFGGGKYAAHSQRILNEIAAARVCLLNQEKKAHYDAALLERLKETAAPAAKPKLVVAMPLAQNQPPATPSPETQPASEAGFLDQITQTASGSASPRPTAARRGHSAKKSNPWPLIAGLAVGVPVLLIVIVLLLPRSESTPQRAQADKSAESARTSPGATADKSQKTAAGKGESASGGAKSGAAKQAKPELDKPEHDPAGKDTAAKEESQDNTEETPDDPLSPSPPTDKGRKTPKRPILTPRTDTQEGELDVRPTPPSKAPGGSRPAVQQRLAEPDEEAIKKAEKEVREVYQGGLAQARSPEQKLALADELQLESQREGNAPAVRFVLLRLASQQASEAGNVERAFGSLDQLGRAFRTNVLPRKAEVLAAHAEATTKHFLRGTHAPMEKQQANERILDAARNLAKAAMDAGDIETTDRCLKIALPAARGLKDPRLLAALQTSMKEVAKLVERRRAVREAETTLQTNADDPAANTLAGGWYCLIQGDFAKGLPCLAKGDDADLAALAKQDLAAPQESGPQSELGDRWWDLAEKKSGLEKTRAQARGAHWYKLALPGAAGLVKTKLQKRLDSLNEGAGRFALRFDGQGSYVMVPNALYNGTMPITIEVVAKPDRNPRGGFGGSGSQVLVASGSYSGLSLGSSYDGWYFTLRYQRSSSGYSTTERVYSERNAGGMGGMGAVPRNRSPEKWSHIAAVYDGRQMKLFVDGQLRGVRPLAGPHAPSAMPFVIGASPGYGPSDAMQSFFCGWIRAVRVSKTPLYTQNFHPPAEFTPGVSTVLLFNFGEGHGEQIRDSSGKNLVGAIHGAEWVELSEADRAAPAKAPAAPSE